MCKRQIKSCHIDWIESDSKRVEDSKNENVLPKQINIKWKRKNKKKWKDWKRWRQKLVSDPQFVEYFSMMSTVACRHKQKRQRKNEFLFRLCLERCLYTIYCDFIIVHIHTPYSISNVCLWLYVIHICMSMQSKHYCTTWCYVYQWAISLFLRLRFDNGDFQIHNTQHVFVRFYEISAAA